MYRFFFYIRSYYTLIKKSNEVELNYIKQIFGKEIQYLGNTEIIVKSEEKL